MQSKLAILITTLFLMFLSCSREEITDNDYKNYFIKAKVDGKTVNVSHLAQALNKVMHKRKS